MKQHKPNLSDTYFIFADNVHNKDITYDKFKALLNFYALLYDKIIIPDTFFINNHYLQRFFNTTEGIEYINKGFVVISVRDGIHNLRELYTVFKNNATLVPHDNEKELLDYLEKIQLNNSIKWDRDGIASNFTQNIFQNINKINILEKDRNNWLDHLKEASLGVLTRQKIYDIIDKIAFHDSNSSSTLRTYIDILYNFNIPSYLEVSAAYPEVLSIEKYQVLTPQQVFFDDVFRGELDYANKEELLTSNLFNEGILASLNFEQISHYRKQQEYKNHIKNIKNALHTPNNSEKIQKSLFDYIYIFDEELPHIISSNLKNKIDKERRTLAIKTMGSKGIQSKSGQVVIDLTNEVVSSALSLAPGIGSGMKIVLSAVGEEHERNIKKMEKQGENIIRNLQSDTNIYDTFKSFSLNSIKQNNES